MEKVIVVILAYNHERYIAESIQSVLNQTTNFELLIFYTKSVDNTEIEIKKAIHGDKRCSIVYLDRNLPFFENCCKEAILFQGKYVVFLDGDDYWINPNKLQIMSDFLDKNEDYAGCFHDVAIKTEKPENSENKQLEYYAMFKSFSQFNTYLPDYYPWDAVNRLIIPPGTLLIRTELLQKHLPSFFKIEYSISWMMSLFVIKYSKFHYFNEKWSVYRNHISGITKQSPHDLFVSRNIFVLKSILADEYYKNFKKEIYQSLSNEYRIILASKNTLYNNKKYRLGISASYFYCKFIYFLIR